MISANGIELVVEGTFTEAGIEQKSHEKTYQKTISFNDKDGERIGDLDIYFVVTEAGRENDSEDIDVYFTVPFFTIHEDAGERFMEEAEAMQFIFTHFASEVQDVVDAMLDDLYDHYDNGDALHE